MNRALWRVAALCLVAAACGDQSPGDAPDAGGGPGAPDASPGAPIDGGPTPDALGPDAVFGKPSDFDHASCETEGPLDAVALPGIWHLDFHFDSYGNFPSVVRFDAAGGGFSALAADRATDDVRVSADDVFVRIAEVDQNGNHHVYAYDACGVAADGSLSGQYASCLEGSCVMGSFRAYRVEPIDEPPAEGITQLGEFNGSPAAPWPVNWAAEQVSVNVRVADDVAYVARYADGLRIVDVSDPAHPVELGHAPTADLPRTEVYNDVKLIDGGGRRYALMASNLRGVVVIDVTDPESPEEVTAFPPPGSDGTVNVHTLFIEGTRAYLADISALGLDIWDLSDPREPQELGGWVDPRTASAYGFVHDLYVEGGRAYLDYWGLGLVVVDTADDPANPTEVGVFDAYERRTSHSSWVTRAGGRTVAVHGDEDFYAHGRIVDVDPDSGEFMTEIGSFETRPWVSIHNIMAFGEMALVAYYQDGIRVMDLSDPTHPLETAHFQTWPGYAPGNGYGHAFYEGAIGIDYDQARGRIFVADSHRGLLVLSLDP